MKNIFKLSHALLALVPLIGFAKPVFQITANANTLALSAYQTNTASFTVTNVSGVNFPNQVGYTPNVIPTGLFSSSLSSSSTCGSSLSNGASCQLILNVTANDTTGNAVLKPKVCYFEHTCSIPGTSGGMTVMIGAQDPLIAVGTNLVNDTLLLAASTNGGTSWVVDSVAGAPASAELSAASCTGAGSTAICTAAGINATGLQPPLLVESTNGGATWSVQTISGLPSGGYFVGTSCTGSGTTAVCIAAGASNPITTPLLAVSTNGGATWNVQSLPGSDGLFNATSCTGNGSTAICTATGVYDPSGDPLLAVTTNGGISWNTINVTADTADLYSTSCTGSGSTAICTAVGLDTTTDAPLISVSTNGGVTWALRSITGAPALGTFDAASCTGSGSTAICIAVGQNTITTAPLLAVSINGGVSWAAQSITGSPASGYFTSSSCTGSGSTAICTAAGKNATNNTPLLAVSTNGGISWSTVTITADAGIFLGTTCIGSGSTAICIAGGEDATLGTSLLAESTNGGVTWTIPTISGIPATGVFSSTG